MAHTNTESKNPDKNFPACADFFASEAIKTTDTVESTAEISDFPQERIPAPDAMAYAACSRHPFP
ncbi:MAG: hypothetical protein LIO69_06250 [Oscillospiraceae bacterium]|nr:hypothetical protein [Oscillospiraceae bacterium]